MTQDPVSNTSNTSNTPTDDGIKKESVRLHGLLGRFLRLPLPFLRACGAC